MGSREGHRRKGDYFVCPHCGEEVEVGARVCPNCGSDDRTGWAEDADKWGAGIPSGYAEDEDFDYEEFIRREFPERAEGVPRSSRALLVAVSALAIALAILLLLLIR